MTLKKNLHNYDSKVNYLAPAVQKMDYSIHRINHYPADIKVCFVHSYPLDIYLTSR